MLLGECNQFGYGGLLGESGDLEVRTVDTQQKAGFFVDRPFIIGYPSAVGSTDFAQGGIRTMWTPLPGFFLAVETLYTQVWTAFGGTGTINSSAPGARPTGVYAIGNQGIWGFIFRAQRNFNTGE